jgi:hypothetical protein
MTDGDAVEGLVSKRRDRPYRGGRSKDWIKVKNRTRRWTASCSIPPICRSISLAFSRATAHRTIVRRYGPRGSPWRIRRKSRLSRHATSSGSMYFSPSIKQSVRGTDT